MSAQYNPAPMPLSQFQSFRVASVYCVNSPALKLYVTERKCVGGYHRRAMLHEVLALLHSVKRGRGYCLHRSQLINLRHHIERALK